MTAPARKTAPRRRPAWIEEEEKSGMMNHAEPLEIAPRRVRRHMPKVWKIIAGFFAAIILIPLAIAIVIGSVEGIAGASSTTPQVVQTTDSQVTTYNDGWIDAKRDDCEQGVKMACQWLDQQHISH